METALLFLPYVQFAAYTKSCFSLCGIVPLPWGPEYVVFLLMSLFLFGLLACLGKILHLSIQFPKIALNFDLVLQSYFYPFHHHLLHIFVSLLYNSSSKSLAKILKNTGHLFKTVLKTSFTLKESVLKTTLVPFYLIVKLSSLFQRQMYVTGRSRSEGISYLWTNVVTPLKVEIRLVRCDLYLTNSCWLLLFIYYPLGACKLINNVLWYLSGWQS